VEIKIELTAKERENLISEFKKRHFLFKGVTPQNNIYVEARKSPYGSYDIKRYRDEAGKFIYTEKIWEMIGNQQARKENQYNVSEKKFKSIVAQFPKALKITKEREWFDGTYKNKDISITIDSVKFDHSPETRYFIEAEIDVKDKNDVSKTRDLILDFFKDLLQKSSIVESPDMFTMALEKK